MTTANGDIAFAQSYDPYEINRYMGNQLLGLKSHGEKWAQYEQLMLQQLMIQALMMDCGETKPFLYVSAQDVVKAYGADEPLNVKYAMADHSVWFTWNATINRKLNGDWVIKGDFDRDIADYSDWHGDPHDYLGNGTLVCPYSQCYKVADIDIPKIGTIAIPDEWMARLVLGGEASNPGFGIYYNTRQSFSIKAKDWNTMPKVKYSIFIKNGSQYRDHELDAEFGP